MGIKEASIAQSTYEVEYVVATRAMNQALCLGKVIQDMGTKKQLPIIIYCYYKSTISMAKNHVFHSRTKHIAIKYHYLRVVEEIGDVKLLFCKFEVQIIDTFIKNTI